MTSMFLVRLTSLIIRKNMLSIPQPLALPGYFRYVSLCIDVFQCILLLPQQWEDALHADMRVDRIFCALNDLQRLQVDQEERKSYEHTEECFAGTTASGKIFCDEGWSGRGARAAGGRFAGERDNGPGTRGDYEPRVHYRVGRYAKRDRRQVRGQRRCAGSGERHCESRPDQRRGYYCHPR